MSVFLRFVILWTLFRRFYKLALTDCETVFEVNLFVSEGV